MRCEFLGAELQSPIVIGSGPLTYGAQGIVRLHEAGAGAVVTKTITREAAVNPDRHMVQYAPGTLINCEKWSDYPMDRWLEREIPASVAAGARVIASVGHTVDDSRLCVERLADEGVFALELVSYDQSTLLPMLEDTKRRVDVPVIVKLSPNDPDMLRVARQCVDAGADALTACDSIGPALKIDIETGQPVLGGDGSGWLSGAGIFPFTLQKISEVARVVDVPIIGLGGVAGWRDGVQMLMAGASVVGVCSQVILKGPEFIGALDRGIEGFLEKTGRSLAEVVGCALPNLGPVRRAAYRMGFDAARCTHCGRCVKVCPYEARSFDADGAARVDEKACRRCGLCVSACPRGCLD